MFYVLTFAVLGSQSIVKGHYEALQAFAVYIANLFYLTSDTLVYVAQDRDLSSDVAGSDKKASPF